MRDFELEVYFTRWHHAVQHHLTASESETTALPDLLAMAAPDDLRRWEDLDLGYTDPLGAPWLRERIALTYDTLRAPDILCFAGAQEGIHCAMHALLGADDHAILVTPNYQSSETIPLGLCAATGVPLDPDRGWGLDMGAITRALRPNTRVISVNFPNNPTGKVLDHPTFDALVTLCRNRGLWLFSDEVYRLIDRDPARRLPQVADVYERGLSLNGMAKGYGLPGLRIGWIACRDAAVLQRMERVKHYLSICSAAPSEVLAAIALRAGERILDRNRGIARTNLTLLRRFFADHADLFDWYVPDGGVIGYPRYKGRDGVETFTRRLIEEAGILLLPASVYHSDLQPTCPDRFRIGFGRADMPRGLAALATFIARSEARVIA